jgi:hypothetical protein
MNRLLQGWIAVLVQSPTVVCGDHLVTGIALKDITTSICQVPVVLITAC